MTTQSSATIRVPFLNDRSHSQPTDLSRTSDERLQLGVRHSSRSTVAENPDLGETFVRKPDRQPTQQLALPLAEQAKSVKAVVSQVDEFTVVLACQLPKDRVEVRLPRELIPTALASYGTPVYLSVEEEGGFRHAVVTLRKIEPREKTREEIELERWLEE